MLPLTLTLTSSALSFSTSQKHIVFEPSAVSVMGRNKKKSKQVESSSDDEANTEVGQSRQAEGGEPTSPVTATAEQEVGSDTGSEGKTRRKKEYRGNKLNRVQGKAKNGKGKEPEEPGTEAASTDGVGANCDDDYAVEVTRQGPAKVLYCPICTFPAEMCEFSGIIEKCRPWLQENAAELAEAEERGRKRRILTEKERLEAMLEGRGIKNALERVVVLEVEKRTGCRMITSVFGMDLFGHNLKDLSREWRKTFSCGAGVRAPEEGKHQDCIDIQGNVAEQLAELMQRKYSIPKEALYRLEKKKRVPFYS